MYRLTLEAGGHPAISCEVVRKRGQRRAVLTVRADARVRVTAPRGLSQDALLRFLRKHHSWLVRELSLRVSHAAGSRERHFRVNREPARAFIVSELAILAPHGTGATRVCVRHNTSRWGSCSSRGTLSFDYRLLFLPRAVARYVLIHELCHLRELNHSKEFWALVAQAEPNYRSLRRALHTYSLHTFYP